MRGRALPLLFAISCGDEQLARPIDAAPSIDASPLDAIAAPIDAGPPRGTATITGTLAGRTIAPTTAFYIQHPLVPQKILAMNESGEPCAVARPPSGLSASIGFACGVAEPRSYSVKPDERRCDPANPHVWVLVEGFSGEVGEYLATDGKVVITALGPSFTGTLDATFDTKGRLQGQFDALVCP